MAVSVWWTKSKRFNIFIRICNRQTERNRQTFFKFKIRRKILTKQIGYFSIYTFNLILILELKNFGFLALVPVSNKSVRIPHLNFDLDLLDAECCLIICEKSMWKFLGLTQTTHSPTLFARVKFRNLRDDRWINSRPGKKTSFSLTNELRLAYLTDWEAGPLTGCNHLVFQTSLRKIASPSTSHSFSFPFSNRETFCLHLPPISLCPGHPSITRSTS